MSKARWMSRTITAAGVFLVSAGGLAIAQTSAAKKPAAAEMPKPALELAQLDWLKGTWRCAGTSPAGAMGPGFPESSHKATIRWGRTLNDFWVMMEYEQKKDRNNPTPVRAHGMVNWDPTTKRFQAWGFDSSGGVSIVTATIATNGTWSAEGEQQIGGQRIPYRETITKKSERELAMKGEWKLGTAEWTVVFEDTCKK